MGKTFRSKIGLEILLPIVIIFGTLIVIMFMERNWPGLIILVIVFSILIHLFTSTIYLIKDGELIIKISFLYRKVLNIQAISKISETNIPFSSPAASLDRLEVVYNKFDSIVISPKDKTGFINEILEQNAAVIINYRKK